MTVSPSTRQKSEISGPSRKDSSSTGLPAARTASTCARAAARSGVTTTPLPPARPSSLTTNCGPKRSSAASISSSAAPGRSCSARAVLTPAASITSLAKALDPSIWAASLLGPKTAMPAARRASATPATSGTSGPMTTRSAAISRASSTMRSTSSTWEYSGWTVARVDMAALPGAAWISVLWGSADRPLTRACSRPPEPITRMRMPTIITSG